MEELTRTASGEYRWEDSITLDEVQKEMEEGILEKRILSISEVLRLIRRSAAINSETGFF